jgi:hemerythrin-like domain-containing protein
MLDIMDAIAAASRAGTRFSIDDVSQIIEFLRVFVDNCHHTKEEQLLFPAIRPAGAPAVEGVIVTLLSDHAQGRGSVSGIAALVPRLSEGDESVELELAEAMSGYTHLLRDHIVREERDCFDVADRELPSVVQEDLAEGYERIERDVVGGGVHESFHALIDRLSQAHLS